MSCQGCERPITTGVEGMEIEVLEYRPTSTLLFLCRMCASNRIVLDNIVDDIERRQEIPM